METIDFTEATCRFLMCFNVHQILFNSLEALSEHILLEQRAQMLNKMQKTPQGHCARTTKTDCCSN